MAEVTVSSLVSAAKVALDMNNSSSALSGLGDIDTLTTDEIIKSKIEDAALAIESAAPAELLEGGVDIPTTGLSWEYRNSVTEHEIHPVNDVAALMPYGYDDEATYLVACSLPEITKKISLSAGEELSIESPYNLRRIYLINFTSEQSEVAAGVVVRRVAIASNGKVSYVATDDCYVLIYSPDTTNEALFSVPAPKWKITAPGEDYKVGYLPLPSDFMRLVSVKMSDWRRAVIEPISETDPLYLQQRSRFAGVRGNPDMPVAAVVTRRGSASPYGSVLGLELYTSTTRETVTVERAQYLKIPTITGSSPSEKIDLCPKLKRAVVYYTAYLSALTWGDGEQAKALLAQAQEMAGIDH